MPLTPPSKQLSGKNNRNQDNLIQPLHLTCKRQRNTNTHTHTCIHVVVYHSVERPRRRHCRKQTYTNAKPITYAQQTIMLCTTHVHTAALAGYPALVIPAHAPLVSVACDLCEVWCPSHHAAPETRRHHDNTVDCNMPRHTMRTYAMQHISVYMFQGWCKHYVNVVYTWCKNGVNVV